MKKLLFWLFALLAFTAAWLTACKKDPPAARFRPFGQVLEYGTKKPIPNALVWLIHCESEFLGPENCWTVLTDTTDAEGRYSFEYDENDSFLAVTTAADRYFEKGASGRLNISAGKRQYNFELYAHSFLELTFKNQSDSISHFDFYVPSSTYPNIFPHEVLQINATLTKEFLVAGELPIVIAYDILDNNAKIRESYFDTVVCKPHQTFFHTICF